MMMKLDVQETLIPLAESPDDTIARLAHTIIEALGKIFYNRTLDMKLESLKLKDGDTQSTKAQSQIRASAALSRAQTAIMANGMLEKLNLDDSIKYV